MKNLRKYQENVVSKIKEVKRLILALDMGLGKTISCLTALRQLKDEGKVTEKVLIVAPKFVATKTWPEEIDDQDWKHIIGDFSYSIITGTPAKRLKALNQDTEIHIINKENIVWLLENAVYDYQVLIWDESSSLKAAKNKTATGNLTRYAAGIHFAEKAEYVVLLSGTPTPNGLQDIYGQAEYIKKGLLAPSKYKFLTKYFTDVSYTRDFPIWKAREDSKDKVIQILGDNIYYLKSEDVLELPEAVYNEVFIPMDAETSRVYDDMEEEGIINFGSTEIVAETAGAKFNKLHQICAGNIYDVNKIMHVLNSDKIDLLKDMVEEEEGILVFYYYKHEYEALKKAFGDKYFVSQDNLDKFKNREIPYLFAQPAQIGHGVNIQQGGNVIVWLSLPTSLELYQQANKRLHRSGQRENVVSIYHMLYQNKIDHDIYKLLNKKGITQDDFIRSLKSLVE